MTGNRPCYSLAEGRDERLRHSQPWRAFAQPPETLPSSSEAFQHRPDRHLRVTLRAASPNPQNEPVIGQLLQGQETPCENLRVMLKDPDYTTTHPKPLRHGEARRANLKRLEATLAPFLYEYVGQRPNPVQPLRKLNNRPGQDDSRPKSNRDFFTPWEEESPASDLFYMVQHMIRDRDHWNMIPVRGDAQLAHWDLQRRDTRGPTEPLGPYPVRVSGFEPRSHCFLVSRVPDSPTAPPPSPYF